MDAKTTNEKNKRINQKNETFEYCKKKKLNKLNKAKKSKKIHYHFSYLNFVEYYRTFLPFASVLMKDSQTFPGVKWRVNICNNKKRTQIIGQTQSCKKTVMS